VSVPVQELPENQAPEVAYNLVELTGERIPREVGTLVVEEEKPAKSRRGRKKANASEEEAPVEEAAVVEDALPRELGS
jgi:hypothetical protein